MRKTPHVAALATAVLLGLAGLVTVGSPASATPRGAACTPVEKAKYQHTFDGPAGTASIELTNGPLCGVQSFSLVSYTTPSATFSTPQFVLESKTKAFTPTTDETKLDFEVEVPECFTQVDFVFDEEIIDPLTDTSKRYNDRKVGSKGAPGNRSTAVPGQPKEAFYNGGAGTCKAEPVVEALSACDGTVSLKLINRSTFSQTFVITGDNGFTKTETLKVRQEPVTVTVPAADAKNLLVKSKNTELYKGGWTKPEDCKAPEVGTPVGGAGSDCDGLDFAVQNPANGKDVTVTFTPNNGAPRSVTATPGETKTVTFPGTKGLVVTVTGDVPAMNGEVAWTAPENCAKEDEPTPSESPSPSTPASASPSASTPADEETPSETVSTTPVAGSDEDPSLPLTGSAAASIAAGAFLLLVAGGVFYFLARRRKVNFTA